MLRFLAGGVAALFFMTVAGAASAQNLVTNGGFESGVLTPFTSTGDLNGAEVQSGFPRTGTRHFVDFRNGVDGVLSQPLVTTIGSNYRVTAYVRANAPEGVGVSLARIGLGTNAPVNCAPLTLTYAVCEADFIAVTATDEVRVHFQTADGSGTVLVDDVSVVLSTPPAPVPTLSEWALILFGLILAGGAALYIHRRQSFA
jgi:hypothetical protein